MKLSESHSVWGSTLMSSVMSIEGSFTYGVLWNVLLGVLRNVPRAWCTTKFLTECSLKVHGLKDVLQNVLPGFLRGVSSEMSFKALEYHSTSPTECPSSWPPWCPLVCSSVFHLSGTPRYTEHRGIH